MANLSFPPLSVTKPALLPNGSDAMLRRVLYDLFALSAHIQAARKEFSKKIGVAAPQYIILRFIAERHRRGGTTVTEISKSLHMHNSFVVLQTGLLVKKGILKRIRNPRDKRSVLLSLSKKGEALIIGVSPVTRKANDEFFGWMSRKEFEVFSAVLARLVQQAEVAFNTVKLAPPVSPRRTANGAQHGEPHVGRAAPPEWVKVMKRW